MKFLRSLAGCTLRDSARNYDISKDVSVFSINEKIN